MAAHTQKELLLALELITSPAVSHPVLGLRAEAVRLQAKAKPWVMGEGVQGVGIAEKITDGEKLGVLAIKVYVAKKLPKSKVEDPVPKELRVPGVEEKIATDVQEIGVVKKEPNTIRVRPAVPGFGLGHVNITVGTFGCLVRKASDPDTLYILSNSHVLADEGTGSLGDPVLQPGPYDGGTAPADLIAELSQWIPFSFTDDDFPNTVERRDRQGQEQGLGHLGDPADRRPGGRQYSDPPRYAGPEDRSDHRLYPGDHPGYQLPDGTRLQATGWRDRSSRLEGPGALHAIHRRR